MSLATTAAGIVQTASLGAWLGVVGFFSFVGAPRAFAVFGDDAGAYVNDVFPRYYLIGVGLGVLALGAGVARAVLTTPDQALVTALLLTAIATFFAAYSRWLVVPRMEAAGEGAFKTYHRLSVVLNGGTLLAVAMALVAAGL